MEHTAPLPELIDDRALRSRDEDLLRHEDVADELAELVCAVKLPSTVAVYGPWGTGKSSLANLLAAKLATRKGVRFARFDAFKYAEYPLRRHFISQVASELTVPDEEFRGGLYRSTTETKFKVPALDATKLLGLFLAILTVVLGAAALLMVILAALADGSFDSNFSKFLNSGLALSFAPAALLAALIALAGKALPVERKRESPSSEEEFERLFKKLVKRVGADRLVIFIDELDRCASNEVVSTLEAVRTFLDVKGCVLIVAADQQVLERALRDQARQATPVDPSNPYYSAGSEYLDKIFQYQLALPPLLPRRLSGLALDLVRARTGLWSQIDQEEVLFALVPTHVRSPRRVKTLLNNFATSYRLAQRRFDAGMIGGDLPARAPELAKLVCLRTEFPLFAADLVLDSKLPSYVLTLAREEELPDSVPDHVERRAAQYASGLLDMDELLVSAGETHSTPPNPIDGDEPTADDDDSRPSTTDEESRLTDLRTEFSQQLLRYLEKTEHVRGPERDLVHFESGGSVFGLDPAFAEQLEDDAVNGRIAALGDEIARLGSVDDRRAALLLLARRTKEASLGREGANMVSGLLLALNKVPADEISPIADELTDAVAAQQRRYELAPENLSGAFILGIESSRSVGAELVGAVLKRDEVLEDEELGLLVTRMADKAVSRYPARVGEVVAEWLLQAATAASDALLQLPDNAVNAVLQNAEGPLQRRLEETPSEE